MRSITHASLSVSCFAVEKNSGPRNHNENLEYFLFRPPDETPRGSKGLIRMVEWKRLMQWWNTEGFDRIGGTEGLDRRDQRSTTL